jgi:hypothetical protein
VIDTGHQCTGKHWTCINLLGRHNVTVTFTRTFSECVMGHTGPPRSLWRQ